MFNPRTKSVTRACISKKPPIFKQTSQIRNHLCKVVPIHLRSRVQTFDPRNRILSKYCIRPMIGNF